MKVEVDLVVTRHPALVSLLQERGLVGGDVEVLSHVGDPSVLEGKVVGGVLPLHLAARCAAVVEIPLALTPELRGKEIDLETLREVAGPTRVYRVENVNPESL